MAQPKRFLIDRQGNRVGVVLDLTEHERLLAEVEELEAIRAYDAAKATADAARRRAAGRRPPQGRSYPVSILRRAQRELEGPPREVFPPRASGSRGFVVAGVPFGGSNDPLIRERPPGVTIRPLSVTICTYFGRILALGHPRQ